MRLEASVMETGRVNRASSPFIPFSGYSSQRVAAPSQDGHVCKVFFHRPYRGISDHALPVLFTYPYHRR